MQEQFRFRWLDVGWFVIVVILAGGVRCTYLHTLTTDTSAAGLAQTNAAPFRVQNAPTTIDQSYLDKRLQIDEKAREAKLGHQLTDFDLLVYHINSDERFASIPPFPANDETGIVEETAHIAPGHPWFCALLIRFGINLGLVQIVLGALTAGLYYVFARLAFRNMIVAVLAGGLCALHPFWIVSTGELADGVLTSFLLATSLVLGVAAGRSRNFVFGLLYGLALAGLCLVRAIFVPFGLVGILWLLAKCRADRKTWLCPLLAVLGFANGLALWSVRNFQTFDKEIVPVSTATYLHVWMGNNPGATGVSMTPAEIQSTLPSERVEELQRLPQTKRFDGLASDAFSYVRDHPAETVKNRIRTTGYFYFGRAWFTGEYDSSTSSASENEGGKIQIWIRKHSPLFVHATLLGMFVLGFLGWRWTHGPHTQTGLAALALLWIPLPYILTHAENYFGPRLPLDGILLSFSAFAIACLIPGLRQQVLAQESEDAKKPTQTVGLG